MSQISLAISLCAMLGSLSAIILGVLTLNRLNEEINSRDDQIKKCNDTIKECDERSKRAFGWVYPAIRHVRFIETPLIVDDSDVV